MVPDRCYSMGQSQDITLTKVSNVVGHYIVLDALLFFLNKHSRCKFWIAGGFPLNVYDNFIKKRISNGTTSNFLSHDIDVFFDNKTEAARLNSFINRLDVIFHRCTAENDHVRMDIIFSYIFGNNGCLCMTMYKTLNAYNFYLRVPAFNVKLYHNDHVISLIKTFTTDNPENLIKRFDFTVCQFYIDKYGDLYGSPEGMQDWNDKKLCLSSYGPHPTFISRVNKYKHRYKLTLDETLAKAYGAAKVRMHVDPEMNNEIVEFQDENDYGEILTGGMINEEEKAASAEQVPNQS